MDRGPLSTAEALRSLARRVGVRAPEIDSGLDWSIELLEALAERGANLVVHIDGERVRDRRFTVLLSAMCTTAQVSKQNRARACEREMDRHRDG